MKLLKFIGVVAVFLVPNSSPAQEDNNSAAASRSRAERCVQGTYYNLDSTESQSLWSLSAGGTFQGVNSAQSALGFSHQLGNWKIVAHNPVSAEATYLDFIFDPGSFVPFFVGRVDIRMVFDDHCETIEGEFELRIFAVTVDPLDPNSIPVLFFQETFEGRRVR